MKIEKISNYTLVGLIVLSIVLFILFFCVGWNNEFINDKNVPLLTDVILFYMYFLVVATAGVCIWAVIRGISSNKGVDSTAITGVPGKKIMMGSLALLVASFGIGFVANLGETDFTSNSGTVTTATWMTISDAFLVSIAILFVVAVAVVAISMTGILTKSATK